jgi:redox-sensing transcriptional repressor
MATKTSDAVVRRLPRYYRQLCALEREGVAKISSEELGARMGVTASQIRQDLSCFGGFGQQGYGYGVSFLRRRVAEILGLDRKYAMIVVGAGNIGQALANYAGFGAGGYEISALFDVDPKVVGKRFGGAPVLHMDAIEGFLRIKPADIAALAVPEGSAYQAAERLTRAGVSAIWNFAPVEIVIQGVVVENAQLTDGLMALTFRLGELRRGAED